MLLPDAVKSDDGNDDMVLLGCYRQ